MSNEQATPGPFDRIIRTLGELQRVLQMIEPEEAEKICRTRKGKGFVIMAESRLQQIIGGLKQIRAERRIHKRMVPEDYLAGAPIPEAEQ